ncbi:hypothetical protein BpOF4_15010 [Alkalihalophilus pseudofirmus OF4]|jgi:hypothetical protein|uniref:DUF1657 domain-containing protein n=2 Tax=Alkalihalophilus pseudofirmus TaxID=79885 RepID=D3FZW6_ALKPO|nr:DUF1657 domain-containing protein [Alkalihalophilus pseudofirmus]ADC51051.1 hypothetical protein BpOF4_15010 [Alkalihalophilus pseudofirmus OF4]MDV2884245.1 DUF1657 domain-containing protein [Alkalihalophilus pseudofirmus]WEG18254.1 DUF1657 domain-containing protein [Alkalihalophilus pseudofirmus]
MSVAAQVKGTLFSLKGIDATLTKLALQSSDEEAEKVYHQASLKTRTIIQEMEQQVMFLEREEPQYKGN